MNREPFIAGVVVLAALLCACTPAPGPEPASADARSLVVAVLPFGVLGQEEGADVVGRAFAAALASNLGQADGVSLVDVPDSTEGASHVVSGTLTRREREVRAEARLEEPTSGEILWRVTVESETGDLSFLASTLAREAAARLAVDYPALYPYIAHVIGSAELATSPLRAQVQSAWRHYDIDEILRASSEVIDRFPDDVDAHVINAFGLSLAWDAAPGAQTLVRLRDRLATLDDVDPASPYDELLRAFVYRSSGEPDQARRLYTEVLGRDDLSVVARAWVLRQRSHVRLQVGDADGARADAERAYDLDPTSALSLVALSKALEAMGDLEGAVYTARQATAIEPFQWRHIQRLGIAYIRAERLDEAAIVLRRACELGQTQEVCANLAVALERAGRPAEAAAAERHAGGIAPSRWGAYNLGCYRALAGSPGPALDYLEQAVELGFADALIKTDPDLDPLRGNSRFARLIATVEERIQVRRSQSRSVFPWQ